MGPCCSFLCLSTFSPFSFLPHIFLVIENQSSFSKNRHENCKMSVIFADWIMKNIKMIDENMMII